MSKLNSLIEISTLQSRLGDTQLGSELEPLGLGADADQGCNGGLGGQLDLKLVGCYAQGSAEAGCVAASDQLLGVGSWAAYWG